MKRISLFVVFLMLSVIPAVSQIYETEYLPGNFIRAEKVDADGKLRIEKIPNGTRIEVKGRIVGKDSTSCRNILAEFEFEGGKYTTEARWLKFSEENNDAVIDIFAADDFSPRFHVLKDCRFAKMNPLSAKGKFLYGLTLPILMFVSVVMALLMLLRGSKRLSLVPFLLSMGLQVYSILMLGEDSWWWCDTHYQTLGGAIAGFIPLALFIALVFSYVVLTWAMSKTEAKIWPVVVCVLAIPPAALISKEFFGSFGVGMAVAFLFPLLVNGIKGGISGIADTVVLTAGVVELLLIIAAGALISGRILVAMITVCPILAVPIVMLFKVGNMKGGITRMPDGTFRTTKGGIYYSYEDAERNA